MNPARTSALRRTGIRLGVAAQVALAAVLLGAVNYAGFHYYFRGDWSPTQKYRLSDQTRQVVKSLPSAVALRVFFSPTTAAPGYEVYGDVVNLLKEYQFAAGDKLTVEYVDPMRNLSRARELQAQYQFGPEENLVIVDFAGRSKTINAADMADYDYMPQMNGEPPRLKAFKGEQALTSALLELSEAQKAVVYFLQGQGESPTGAASSLSLFEEYLGRQGLEVRPLDLGLKQAIPEDARAIVIAGSRYDISEVCAGLLEAWWKKNGRLFVLLDPDADTPQLRGLLAAAGVAPREDRVLRTVNLGFATGILRDVSGQFSADSRVTRRLAGATATLPGATCSLALDTAGAQQSGLVLQPLITAGEPFWGETEYITDEAKGVDFDGAKDTAAPLVVAALSERGGVADEKVGVSSARLVAAGNCEFLTDGSITEPNLDFAISALNWLLDRGHLAGLAPKPVQAFSLNLTDLETGRIAFYTLVVIPAGALLAGIAVWWRRRR